MKSPNIFRRIKYKIQNIIRIKKNHKLVKKYPWLKINEDLIYIWYDYIPSGWRKAFGKQLIEEINRQIIKDNLSDFYILEIKEKWGGLRMYVSCASEGVYDIIKKYEDMSFDLCINCGKPADWTSKGYILPYCDKCAKKVFNKEEKWYKTHIVNYTKKPFENYYSKVDKGE